MKGFMTAVFILFAVIAVSIGYMNYSRIAKEFQNCTAETNGEVVDFKARSGKSSTRKILYPIVEYYVGGKGYQVTSGSGTNRQKLKVGDEVVIHYNPHKPPQMLIAGYETKSSLYFCMAIMVMGVVIPAASIIFIWKSK